MNIIGEKCDTCNDGVFIIKKVDQKRLCLDCYYAYYKDKNTTSQQNTNQKPNERHINHSDDRQCPECKRYIPFDANICPYCCKEFKSYL